MNRIFGIILCVFSLVGLVSAPALAAMNCAIQHQQTQDAIEGAFTDLASNLDIKSKHCEGMATPSATAPQVDNGFEKTSVMFAGMDCDCSSGCSLTAPAVISNVEASFSSDPSGFILMSNQYFVVASFRSRLYRPPIT